MQYNELNQSYSALLEELLSVMNQAAGQALQSEIKVTSGQEAAEVTPEFTPGNEFPLLRLTFSTSGTAAYDHQFLIDRSLAGIVFSWMVGGDPPEEIGDEHLDAVKEAVAQIIGQLQAAFDGEDGAFTPGEVAIAELSATEELILPEGGLVATYKFSRGEDDTEYLVTHIIQGAAVAEEAVEAQAGEGAAEATEAEAETGIDDMSPDDFGEEVLATAGEDASADEAGETAKGVIDVEAETASIDDIFSEEFEEPASEASTSPVEASPVKFDEFRPNRTTDGESRQIDMLLDVELDVTVELGRKIMLVEEILRLGKGSVVELNRLAGEPVDILVNGKKLAEGEVVVVEDHFGVRLTHLIDPRERIRSLGRE